MIYFSVINLFIYLNLIYPTSFDLLTGWMEKSTFACWFNVFLEMVTEQPLLLLYDGHLAHISIPLIKATLQQDVLILKFPPHVTDVSQPLDVACFGPLKRIWEAPLQKRANKFGSKHCLTRSESVTLISAIWKEGMKKENAISRFEKTGKIFVTQTISS